MICSTHMDGTFTVGQLVAFRMLAGRVSGPVLRLVQLWQEYQQASLSVKRIGDIFNSPAEPGSPNALSSIPQLEGKIVFDKVRFRYRADTSEVIKDMSFEIEPNTTVGIVGRSGSGKSTVSKLIQRLYIAESGKISIDGMDILMINPAQLRTQIGVVLQENFMFNGTVAENIAIHQPGAPIEKIIVAAKTAGAHEFILELTNGYDTTIGEKAILEESGNARPSAVREMEEYIESLEHDMELGEKNYRQQMYSMLNSFEDEKADCEAQLERLLLSSDAYLVKSPADGYVNMISVARTGQTVTSGTLVATIVPMESLLIFECYVPDSSRSEIEVGMEAKIKLAAFPFSDYGEITGTVRYISPSTFSTEAYGNVYVVNIEIESETLSSEIVLTSGLSGNAEILVGQRTVMQYFLEPIMGTLRDSMKES